MENNIFLNSQNIYLRPLEEKDISSVYLNGINDQDKDLFTDHALFPKNIYSLHEFASSQWNGTNIWLGIFLKSNNEHIGNIEIFNFELVHRKAEYSIILWSHSGNGYAYESSFVLLKHLFNKLNLNRVSLSVNAENIGARKLYEKLGFQEEGTQREAFIRNEIKYDFIIMGLLRSDFFKISKKEI